MPLKKQYSNPIKQSIFHDTKANFRIYPILRNLIVLYGNLHVLDVYRFNVLYCFGSFRYNILYGILKTDCGISQNLNNFYYCHDLLCIKINNM